MVVTAGDLNDAGIDVPLLVGGAAFSEKFTKMKIGPSYSSPTFYAKDAMTGLRLMNEIMDPELREQVLSQHIFHDVPPMPLRRNRWRFLRRPAEPQGPHRISRFRRRLISTAMFGPSLI